MKRENEYIEHCAEKDCPECNKAAFNAGVEEERKRVLEWCDKRIEENISTFGPGKRNFELHDLINFINKV